MTFDKNDMSNEAFAGFFQNNPNAEPETVLLELGMIAKKLYETFRFSACECVDTDEFAQYVKQRDEYLNEKAPVGSPHRMLLMAAYETTHPFVGEQIAHECARCEALRGYEQFIGEGDLS